ncbi:cytochrome P450 [Streptomyces sp. BH104]|uniref:cytochrome P450 n=1 Tax=Streptomyces sp. BH104 TaxID=3410407 RepID=UPI003BB55331
MSAIPASDVDLYTPGARADPYPVYQELRDLGPVVHLSRHDLYALPRYQDVRAALTDWRTLSSARGVFVDPGMNARLEGITLCSDPPEHTATRAVLGRPLRQDRMRDVTPTIEAEAERIVADLLRADRSLIPHAINESLRLETPVPRFSRVLTEGHEIDGVALPAGSRVALRYGSANRDERHYPAPERFDITRRPSDHLAFGRGEHVCVGMHLARLEMGALLDRLADRVSRFEAVASTPLLNNGLRGLEHLEVTVRT